MLFLFTAAIAQFLVPTTAHHLSAHAPTLSGRDTDCGGIASGTTYTAGGKTFVVEADALRSNNNLGDPIFGGSFTDCMTSCATTTGCTDVSFTSGGTCYLKQGTVGGITGVETGTCDAKVIPTPTASATCSRTTNAVVNGNFEEMCCGYLTPWTLLPGKSSDGGMVLKQAGTGAADGSYVLGVTSTNPNNPQYFTQAVSFCPGTTYRLSFAAKRVSPAANSVALYVQANVQVGIHYSQVVMYSKNVASDSWTTFTADYDVVIPATDATSTFGLLEIQFINIAQVNTGTKEIWFDEIQLMPVS